MEKQELLFLINDRIQKIRQITTDYNILENGYIAFSGGKDSTVLSDLVDRALPGNKIPRIYSPEERHKENTCGIWLSIQKQVSFSHLRHLFPTRKNRLRFEICGAKNKHSSQLPEDFTRYV